MMLNFIMNLLISIVCQKINYLYFSKLGSFEKLQTVVGKKPGEVWSHNERIDFRSLFLTFQSKYDEIGGENLKEITCGDAFLAFTQLYGYKELLEMSDSELTKLINSNFSEFELMSDTEVDLRMTASTKKASVFTKLLTPGAKHLKVAFIYEKLQHPVHGPIPMS